MLMYRNQIIPQSPQSVTCLKSLSGLTNLEQQRREIWTELKRFVPYVKTRFLVSTLIFSKISSVQPVTQIKFKWQNCIEYQQINLLAFRKVL